VCWGDNDSGEVGDGNPSIDAAAPTQVVGLTSGVADVTAGGEHTCALTVGGGVQCWGDNGSGQLGSGAATQMETTPVQVVGLASGATAVATGPGHTCAALDGGGVACWGSNWAGQLGNGESGQVTAPVQVAGLTSGVTAVSAGQSACAVVDGALTCWGHGGHGQLGVGTLADASTPTQVTGLTSGVTTVSTGQHTCAVTAGGAVKCWGANASGELGDGTTADRLTPVQVSGLTSGATAVATGGAFSCAITSTGAVECWGDNGVGQLGDGSTTASGTPVQVSGLTSGVQAIAAGLDFACALTSAGAVTCWGDNDTGQLGDGSTTTSPAPVQVTGLTSGVTAIGAGIRHACAVTSAGAAVCWGANWEDQLGTGVLGGSATTPTQVVGLTSGVTAVSGGRAHTCAVVSGGLMCWGSGTSGQLGNGHSDGLQPFPDQVVGLTGGVTAVSAGDDNTCAIASGALTCWGSRAYGAVGNGTSTIVPTPVAVVGY
jgi:alpha-tubulin suppressor-like RCC1 family protein